MKKLSFLLLFLSLVLSIGASARILDIIIGGSNGGLECKTDGECGTDKYCNQEQYYCAPCNVPSHEWTGTECRCPANKPVEKSETECVECLIHEDCKTDNFCKTDTNTCVECKKPKEWKDNACVCPAKSHPVGDTCECDNPNEQLDEFNFCACTLTPESCKTTELNLNACQCCPANKPTLMSGVCASCAQIDPSKPVWKPDTKTCVECTSNSNCPSQKPVCTSNTCVQCTQTNNCAVNQYCNNTTCTPCPSNQVRPQGQQNCQCPSNLPYWNGSRCVQCTQNDQCGGNNVCANNTCKPFTCQNVGYRSNGLRIKKFDPSRDMSGNPHLGGIWDNGSVMGSSRKDCNDGILVSTGVLYAARAGTYSFRVMGGDWGKSRVTLYMDGQTVYSATNQNPGIAHIWVSEGAHSFTYDGWMSCRRNIIFDYDGTYVKACTND